MFYSTTAFTNILLAFISVLNLAILLTLWRIQASRLAKDK